MQYTQILMQEPVLLKRSPNSSFPIGHYAFLLYFPIFVMLLDYWFFYELS